MSGPRNINVAIRKLLSDGVRPVDIQKQFSCSLSTITYHAKRMGLGVDVRPTYDWVEIKAYYDQGHSINDCIKKFGCSGGAWWKAVKVGKIIPRLNSDGTREYECTPLEKLLTPGKNRSRCNVKKRLLQSGLLKKVCSLCGLTEWRGKPLAFNLDHADGDKLNWALENLRMVCPNCDSQQETFAGKNVKRLREQRKFQFGASVIGNTSDSESEDSRLAS